MIVLSPYAKGNHYSNSTYYTQGSTLRTIQEIFGVYPLIRNAGSETGLRSLFSVFPLTKSLQFKGTPIPRFP